MAFVFIRAKELTIIFRFFRNSTRKTYNIRVVPKVKSMIK